MLSDTLLYYRKNLRLSQEELAGRLGVSRQALAKWESGETTPELKYCLALAQLFEVTLDELVAGPLGRDGAPVGKYVFGIVAPDGDGRITLPTEALEVMGIQPGDRLLLLGDVKNGLALVPYETYERFAREVLQLGENDHD